MPYTLVKGLAWILIAVVLGILIGWFMRHVTARREVARARSHNVDAAELERLRARVAELQDVVAERDRLRAQLDADPLLAPRSDEPTAVARAVDAAPPNGGAPPDPSLLLAAESLGGAVDRDDLTVIEGIGPKVRELCHGIGIRTWADLADTEVSLLRTMLADAGPRFRTHDPSTWPQQAALLAAGRWADFKALTDELRGGRTPG